MTALLIAALFISAYTAGLWTGVRLAQQQQRRDTRPTSWRWPS